MFTTVIVAILFVWNAIGAVSFVVFAVWDLISYFRKPRISPEKLRELEERALMRSLSWPTENGEHFNDKELMRRLYGKREQSRCEELIG